MRFFLLALAVGYANLPITEVCEPGGESFNPAFLRVGGDDQILASLSYVGCPEQNFRLCGTDPDWLTVERARLSILHTPDDDTCSEDVVEDRIFQLGPVRRAYEEKYDVESGTFVIEIGDRSAEYTFESLVQSADSPATDD